MFIFLIWLNKNKYWFLAYYIKGNLKKGELISTSKQSEQSKLPLQFNSK